MIFLERAHPTLVASLISLPLSVVENPGKWTLCAHPRTAIFFFCFSWLCRYICLCVSIFNSIIIYIVLSNISAVLDAIIILYLQCRDLSSFHIFTVCIFLSVIFCFSTLPVKTVLLTLIHKSVSWYCTVVRIVHYYRFNAAYLLLFFALLFCSELILQHEHHSIFQRAKGPWADVGIRERIVVLIIFQVPFKHRGPTGSMYWNARQPLHHHTYTATTLMSESQGRTKADIGLKELLLGQYSFPDLDDE